MVSVTSKRLNIIHTEFGENIAFSLRTFRFIVPGTQTSDQQQRISCNLHLEPIADVSTSQPDDCSCYTEAACTGPGKNK